MLIFNEKVRELFKGSEGRFRFQNLSLIPSHSCWFLARQMNEFKNQLTQHSPAYQAVLLCACISAFILWFSFKHAFQHVRDRNRDTYSRNEDLGRGEWDQQHFCAPGHSGNVCQNSATAAVSIGERVPVRAWGRANWPCPPAYLRHYKDPSSHYRCLWASGRNNAIRFLCNSQINSTLSLSY